MLEITADTSRIATKLTAYAGKIDRVVVRAINRSIGSARTVIVREAASDTGLKSKVVRDALILREANLSSPEASLRASGKRIPLINFGATGPYPSRGKGRGVSYRVQTGRARLEHAFIATMPSGHVGVFMRKGKARLGIRELKGPSLWRVFQKFRELGLARAREAMVKNLAHEFSFANSDEYAETRFGLGLDV